MIRVNTMIHRITKPSPSSEKSSTRMYRVSVKDRMRRLSSARYERKRTPLSERNQPMGHLLIFSIPIVGGSGASGMVLGDARPRASPYLRVTEIPLKRGSGVQAGNGVFGVLLGLL